VGNWARLGIRPAHHQRVAPPACRHPDHYLPVRVPSTSPTLFTCWLRQWPDDEEPAYEPKHDRGFLESLIVHHRQTGKAAENLSAEQPGPCLLHYLAAVFMHDSIPDCARGRSSLEDEPVGLESGQESPAVGTHLSCQVRVCPYLDQPNPATSLDQPYRVPWDRKADACLRADRHELHWVAQAQHGRRGNGLAVVPAALAQQALADYDYRSPRAPSFKLQAPNSGLAACGLRFAAEFSHLDGAAISAMTFKPSGRPAVSSSSTTTWYSASNRSLTSSVRTVRPPT